MKRVKEVLIFSSGVLGGFLTCGAIITKAVVKSDTLKKAISSAIADKIVNLLYSEDKQAKSSRKIKYRPYSYYSHKKPQHMRDLIFDNRGEAEDVLSRIGELISAYQVVSVADVYDLCGLTSCYTDNTYGWTSVVGMSVFWTKEGYMLKLPSPRYLLN